MLNPIKKFRDRLAEKTKIKIYVAAVALVLIVCSVLPLAFYSDDFIDDSFDTGARAAMFVKYSEKDSSIRVKVDNKPDDAEIRYCNKIFDEIYERCIVDSKTAKVVSKDMEFINISDGENSMRLCRMWTQDQGDWTNWLDVYIDADTGFMYYLYLNSTCLDNPGIYYDAVPYDFGCKYVAEQIAADMGYKLEMLSWSGMSEDAAKAFTQLNGDALIWNIYCSYYPATMLDLKIFVA